MAASFAAYASQYLNRQQQVEASLSSSHPMFFSFSTNDGSRGGHGHDTDLDDLDDPHLRDSNASTAIYGQENSSRVLQGRDDDDDDPYLRLDEDERTGRHGFESRYQHQSAPLIAADENESVSSGSPKGWLAHLAASPSLHRSRSPSPAPSSSDSAPPPELFGAAPASPPRPSHTRTPPPPPRATRPEPHSLSLTESLLPRDGRSRPLDVFSLPDPRHTPRGRRKYNDPIWTSVWLTGVSICVVFSIVVLFAAHQPDKRVPRLILPYTTLLHTVPLLTILTFVSAAVAYVHIFLLQIFVRPVMIATSVFIPVTLLISSIWAFIGSFMWDGETEPTWGETVGLRLFAIIPLVLAAYTGRRLLHLPHQIHTTSSTLTLTTHLLISNPFLLALSPAVLLLTLLASLPFLTLIFRLLLIGYATSPPQSAGWEWHVRGWANWSIAGAVAVWLWTWGVARGAMRMTTASVIGAWYFSDPSLPPPPPTSTHTIHSAIFRATGPSLGTTVLSALILTVIRMLTLFTLFLQRLPVYLPLRIVPVILPGIRYLAGYIEGVTTALSKYALVYAGLTGDNFMGSARRARSLTSGVENTIGARDRRRGFGKEPPLTLLTISPLTLTFPFALITYLFVAHTLNAPNEALGAAVLAGGVTGLVGLFCVGLVKDTADTLYLCYCIDKDVGQRGREEVFIIFEPDSVSPPTTRNRIGLRGPEDIVTLPPAQTAGQPTQTPKRANQPQPGQQTSIPQPSPQTQQPPPPLQQQQQRAQPPPQPQHQRLSSYSGSAKSPLSPFAPSTSIVTQPMPIRTVPLAPPPEPLSDDDPDPFKKSLVEEEDEDERPAPVMQPLHLKRESLGGSPRSVATFTQMQQQQQQRLGMESPRKTSFSPPSGNRLKTSAELNMKSHMFDSRRRLSGASGRGRDADEDSSGSGGSMSVSRLVPYDVGGELEKGMGASKGMGTGTGSGIGTSMGMSQSRATDASGKAPEDSDLFPGSGFFD